VVPKGVQIRVALDPLPMQRADVECRLEGLEGAIGLAQLGVEASDVVENARVLRLHGQDPVAPELEAVDPRALYMVEAYPRVGQVRFYTRGYVARLLAAGQDLPPLSFTCLGPGMPIGGIGT